MKRQSSTAQGPIQFKGPRTPTKEVIAKVDLCKKNLKDKKRSPDGAIHQMDSERLGRLMHDLRWRAQHGDKEAAAFLKVKR
jgi:hypothetical protein